MVLLAWLLADFITGLIHWFEDKCLNDNSKYKFIQAVTNDNILHHKKPTALCELTIWKNIDTSVVIAWPLAVVLYLAGAPHIISLAVFFASFGNLVHMWAHQRRAKVPYLVQLAQGIGLMGSQEHHFGHHYINGRVVTKGEAKIRYCVMTDWLNPFLDYIGFFDKLEKIINGRGR